MNDYVQLFERKNMADRTIAELASAIEKQTQRVNELRVAKYDADREHNSAQCILSNLQTEFTKAAIAVGLKASTLQQEKEKLVN